MNWIVLIHRSYSCTKKECRSCLLYTSSKLKNEYESVRDAFTSVKMKGYGVVSPTRDEITLDEPVVIRQGNKYGVKIHSSAPSIHLIRANIETEIAPIVGDEKQAEDLITYIHQMASEEDGIWNTNICLLYTSSQVRQHAAWYLIQKSLDIDTKILRI